MKMLKNLQIFVVRNKNGNTTTLINITNFSFMDFIQLIGSALLTKRFLSDSYKNMKPNIVCETKNDALRYNEF